MGVDRRESVRTRSAAQFAAFAPQRFVPQTVVSRALSVAFKILTGLFRAAFPPARETEPIDQHVPGTPQKFAARGAVQAEVVATLGPCVLKGGGNGQPPCLSDPRRRHIHRCRNLVVGERHRQNRPGQISLALCKTHSTHCHSVICWVLPNSRPA